MPNHASPKKQIRKAEKATLRNKMAVSRLRTTIKKTLGVTTNEEGVVSLRESVSIIDKAVKNGLLHKNNAARKKSRLALSVNALKK